MRAILELWRGELPLGRALWLWGVLGGVVVALFFTLLAVALLAAAAPVWLAALSFAAHSLAGRGASMDVPTPSGSQGTAPTSHVVDMAGKNRDSGVPARRTLAGPVTPGWSGARADREPPMTPTRLMVGFIAGFLSVLTFQSGLIAILYAAGAVPFAPWSMAPVPPFGVPQSLSAAFWGGLWGVAYALLEPRLTARLGWWSGGLAFGAVLPVLVLWFIVMPLKGLPLGGGFAPSRVLLVIVIHAVFGLGTAIIFRFGQHLAGRRASLSPAALSDRSRG